MTLDVRTGTGRPPTIVWFIFAMLLAGILVGARYFYLVQRDRVVQSRILVIQGVALIQRNRVQAWLDSCRDDARFAALAWSRFLSRTAQLPAASRREEARARATAEQEVRGYHGIHLLDATGRPLVSVSLEDVHNRAAVLSAAREAMQSNALVLVDDLDASGRLHILCAAPVLAATGSSKVLGAVVLDLDPEATLFRAFLQQTGPSLSWESILLLAHRRRAVWLRRPEPPPPGAVSTVPVPPRDTALAKALAGRLGHFEGTDERGRTFLTHVEPLAQAGWILVTRESTTETDRLVRAFAIPYAMAVVALIAMAFVLLAYVWQLYAVSALRARLDAESRERKAQQELAESRALLQTILDTVPQRIFWKDRESCYLGCNLPFALDAGRDSPASLIGENDYALSWYRNADLYRTDDREVMDSGQPKIGYEEPQDRPDGTRRWLRTSKVPLKREDGTVYGVLGTYEDITELVETRRALEDTRAALEDRNRELSQLLYLVSHDLRSPLVTVQGFARELEKSVEEILSLLSHETLSDAQKHRLEFLTTDYLPRCIRYVNQGVRSMDRLLRGILDLSRLDRTGLRSERVDMNRVAATAVQLFAQEVERTGAAITVEPLPPCVGDAARLEQVLTNLISNALKFRAHDRPCTIRISGRVEDGFAVYCVEDNGIGIPEEERERVFEMFHRAAPDHAEGDGLGLTSVRLLVRKHGGRCWIESTTGVGTKVYFTVPALGEASSREGGP